MHETISISFIIPDSSAGVLFFISKNNHNNSSNNEILFSCSLRREIEMILSLEGVPKSDP